MALDVGGRHDEAARAYEWLRVDAEPRRLVARVLRRQRREGPDARHERRLLPRHRRLAPLPLHRRHRVPRATSGRSSSARSTTRSATRPRPARSRGAPTTPPTARCSPARRASTSACAARSRSPSGSVTTAPTGSCRSARSPSRSRTGPSASSTRVAGRWTGTTRSSAACSAARPRRCASPRSGTRSSSTGRGVRCVSDQPWVTAAETCELVMALDAIGETERAHELFRWVQFLRHDDGALLVRHELRRRALRPARRALHRRPARRGTPPPSCSPRTRSAARARPRACSAARTSPSASAPRSSSQAGVEIEHERNRR